MEVIIKPDPQSASHLAARIVARQIRRKADSVLGLATGRTPLLLYRELIRMHREEDLDFSRVLTFNLDEYWQLAGDAPGSYHRFMSENLFEAINVLPANIQIPDGTVEDVPAFCRRYETLIHEAGGIDLQVLGLGVNGHIGFNEPSSSLSSRTRLKSLTRQTLAENAAFFGSVEEVPRHVITMGIGTILESKRCLLLAFGERKAKAVARMVEGPITAMVPASALQLHPRVQVILDEPAAGRLQLRDYYDWVYESKPEWQRIE